MFASAARHNNRCHAPGVVPCHARGSLRLRNNANFECSGCDLNVHTSHTGKIAAYLFLIVHFILFYFSHHGNSKSFESLTSIKPQNAPWCPHSKTPGIPSIHPRSVEEWVGALDWRPGGPGFESCCGNFASELW